jgi:Tol biopolymer transport system component
MSMHLALLLPLLAAPAQQTHKLNPPLARGITGELLPFSYGTFDGEHLLYFADAERNGYRLWSVASSGAHAPVLLGGSFAAFVEAGSEEIVLVEGGLVRVRVDGRGERVPLTPPFAPHAGILALQLAGERVVYVGDVDADETYELFSVPLAGDAPPVRLSAPLVADGDVLEVLVAPDGHTLLYRADQDADEIFELFVVPADGSAPARELPIPLVAGGDVGVFRVVPDGRRVVYVADQDEDERFELFSIALDGREAPRRLNAPLVAGGDVGATYFGETYSSFGLTPDGRRAFFQADAHVDEVLELHSAPVDGSAPSVVLAAPISAGYLGTGLVTPDSSRVVYGADAREPDTVELYSVPVDGSQPPVRLSGPMGPDGDVHFAQIDPDGLRVVYVADQELDRRYELYSVPPDGSHAPVKLNAPFPPGGSVAAEPTNLLYWFQVVRGGVLYLGDQVTTGDIDLFLVGLEGGTPPRRIAEGPIESFNAFETPRGAQVYFAREDDLFLVRTRGRPGEVDLDALPTTTTGDVMSFELVPDGSRAVYRAQQRSRATELFGVSTGGRRDAVRLHPELAPGREVEGQWLVPDGSRVLFAAALADDDRAQLYSVAVDGSAAPVSLSGSLDFLRAFTDPVVIAPDGRSVVFLARVEGSGGLYSDVLFGAPVDGSAPAVRLSPPAATDVRAGARISADGTRVAFLVGNRLFAASLDGTAPGVLISAPGQVVEPDFRIAPDGARVVYRIVPTTFRRSEVFSAPADASAPPLLLGAMPAFGDATALALSADGRQVVYRADVRADGLFELFAVPASGGAEPLRLHPELAPDRDVGAFEIAPDSTRVAFIADARTDERFELFAAPLDASRPPALLNGPLVDGGDVHDLRISPDSTRVLYRADEELDGTIELFAATLRGPGARAKLGNAVPGGYVGEFRISADSSTVAFATHDAERVPGPLFAAPLTGQHPARELGSLAGIPPDLAISADGSVVAYRSQQDEVGVTELYAARIPGRKGR